MYTNFLAKHDHLNSRLAGSSFLNGTNTQIVEILPTATMSGARSHGTLPRIRMVFVSSMMAGAYARLRPTSLSFSQTKSIARRRCHLPKNCSTKATLLLLKSHHSSPYSLSLLAFPLELLLRLLQAIEKLRPFIPLNITFLKPSLQW